MASDGDFAEKINDTRVGRVGDPWSEKNPNEIDPDREEASAIWNAFPEGNRAWFESFGVLPYENIIDVDDKGDDWFDQLHIYTTAWSETHGPFSGYFEHLQTNGRTPRATWNEGEAGRRELRGLAFFPEAAQRFIAGQPISATNF